MCGLLGLIGPRNRELPQKKFLESLGLLAHRGPDDEGWLNAVHELDGPHQVLLGHRRLSILDLSDKGRQPMLSADKKIVVIHNGEIYNFIELRNELERFGYPFQTGTDTEVILAAYQKWGMQCVHRFNGMWAFAILDFAKKHLFLSRDRFGVKPIYFAVNGNQFAFSSEIKALRNLSIGLPRWHFDQMARFLFTGELDDSRQTLYDGIFRILPGEYMMVNLNLPHIHYDIRSYYNPTITETSLKYEDWVTSIKELLLDSVRLRLRADVPSGSCLSGGLDSSALVSLTYHLRPTFRQKSFTCRFVNPELDELKWAKIVSDATQCDPNVVEPNLDDLWSKDYLRLHYYQEEPFQSTSVYAQWKVMELAKSCGVKVLLDGQGADELFGGYHKYIPIYYSSLLWSGRLGALVRSWLAMEQSGLLSLLESRMRLALSSAAMGMGFNQLRYRRLASLFREGAVDQEMFSRPDGSGFKEFLRHDLLHGLQPLLRYEDKNSMAHSIEARTPFLDYRLVELVLSGREDWFYFGGWTKAPLRMATEHFVPDKIRWRKDKLGFATPEAAWYRAHSQRLLETLFRREGPLWEWMDYDAVKTELSRRSLDSFGFAPWRWLQIQRSEPL